MSCPGALDGADAPVCSFGEIGNAVVEVDLRSTPFKRLRLGNSTGASVPRQRCFLTDIPISIRPDLLVHELQRELHLARRFRLKDMVERWRTDVAVGQPEVRAVQDVKQLRAELYMR